MRRARSRLRPALARAVCGLALTASTVFGAGPAPGGGRGLLEAMEGDTLTLVGRLDEVQRLDAHGYSARIWVERVVGARAGDFEPGTPVRFAWEELASGRPPRFAPAERVLLVLERLPRASIWRTRIADPMTRRETLAVALSGDAFVRDPALASADLLHHYLSIAPGERGGAAGVRFLTDLAAEARPPLAIAAAARLARVPGAELGPAGEAALVRALLRDDAGDALAAALLPVFDDVRSDSLAALLRGAAKGGGTPPPPRLYDALARASGEGLSADERARLLTRDEAGYRLVAVRGMGPDDLPSLRELAREDPDPEVRAAALEQIVDLSPESSLPDLLAALADPAPAVRAVATREAAGFGDRAVPDLRAIAYGSHPDCCASSREAPRAAIASLGLAGPAGRRALAEIARDHPDPALRKMADLARGELDAHVH